MSEQGGIIVDSRDYRGYLLTSVEDPPGWRVRIHPGPGLLHTLPDQIAGMTKEEAFAKARAIIDSGSTS